MSGAIEKWSIVRVLGSKRYILLDAGSNPKRIVDENLYNSLLSGDFQQGAKKRVTGTVTENYTVTTDDTFLIVDTSGGSVSLAMPTAASMYDSTNGTSLIITIKRSANDVVNSITVNPDGSEDIDGGPFYIFGGAVTDRISVYSDGSNLFIIDDNV